MSKSEFLDALKKELSGLPKTDIEERLSFYSEMIDDRIEDGLSEEDAVLAIGSVENIAAQIIADTPFTKLAKEKINPKRRLKVWEILLIVLGFPLWFSILISAFAIALSLYTSVWAIIICLWAIFGALVGSAFGAIVGGIVFLLEADIVVGIALIGMGIFCAGIGIFSFFGCKAATKGLIWLTKKALLGVKKGFISGGTRS